jgi:hypothetical protein
MIEPIRPRFGACRPDSRFQFPGREVVLRRNPECVCYAIEKSEHCGDVDSFCDLFFFPPQVSKFLNILGSRAIGSIGDEFDVVQQSALRWSQACFFKFTFDDSLYALIRCSLDTQEVSVAVQSIRTAVQIGDVARD